MRQLNVRQRPIVRPPHVVKNHPLAVRLINGQVGRALQLSDCVRRLGPSIQQRHNLPVDLVNLPPPVCDIHAFPHTFSSSSPIMVELSCESCVPTGPAS